MLLNKEIVLEYFNISATMDEILAKLKSKGFSGFNNDNVEEYGNYVLVKALYYSNINYPDALNIKSCSFATLLAYLTSDWYGGFGTESYDFERKAETIIRQWKSINKLNDNEFTKRAIKFLDYFYFKNPMLTIEIIPELNIPDNELSANIIMYLIKIINNTN